LLEVEGDGLKEGTRAGEGKEEWKGEGRLRNEMSRVGKCRVDVSDSIMRDWIEEEWNGMVRCFGL
jgi:hypothetical protein